MNASSAVSAAVLLFGLTTAASAQSSASGQSTVNVEQLPIDVARIQRGLQQSTIREERDGLGLKYFVDVYGRAPLIVLFDRQDNLLNGPVPYGAPTHSQMLEIMTPKEFRSPAMDFSALIRWLSNRAKDKK